MADKKRTGLAATILKAGLLAGALDITIALIQYYIKTGKNPTAVLKFIASAVFGKEAFLAEGYMMAVYGLLFHFLIAFIWTGIFFVIYPRMIFMQKSIVATAVFYGLFVWVVMNQLVLPLSYAPTITFDLSKALLAMFILVVAIGLPLSFFAKRYYHN